MSQAEQATLEFPLRKPSDVMRLARLGSFHQSRLSFMRILTRRMARENWEFTRPHFEINDQGVGYAVYSANTGQRTYSLIAFAHDLPADKRSDRVIAEAWDSTFALFDGVPTKADIERLSKNVPFQEAGRISEKELSLSRANRSVRLWQHVVSSLANGQQPDIDQIVAVGYLMRTTAVYGSGKFGAADRETVADRPEFKAPFQVELLSVYLTRAYVRDLVQHMANVKGGDETAKLDPEIARRMGIGNSTGLGMAPFLINHPELLNNWIKARETAIARVRNLPTASTEEIAIFKDLVHRSEISAQIWNSEHPIQIEKLKSLRPDLAKLRAHVETADLSKDYPWNALLEWANGALRIDAQECLASLILEPYPELVDPLSDEMAVFNSNNFRIDGTVTVAATKDVISRVYGWALKIDWEKEDACARAWYVSEEKLEPRLGERFEEPIEEYEQALAPGRDAARLMEALNAWDDTANMAEFLLRHPEHRHMVRRVQITSKAPYSEICDNTIGAELLPIDMLRCKLSFFGATHFDPRSDRWVRICLYGNAPYPDELSEIDADVWPYPPSQS